MTERSLNDWLAYLERLHPSAIDMGLDRSRAVAQALGLGRPAPRVVTVTGTNGKGSTCAFIAQLFATQGLKTGLYSSPHLRRYNERVRIEGREASDSELCEAFEAVERARGDISLTYFEMGTLAAFWLFERAQLDAVVLEVGLGGRLDAVNLIDADVAVVTNIGLDHAEWLGDSRESVALEKAGIFRTGAPAVCGDPLPPATLLESASRLPAPLKLRGRDFDLCVDGPRWRWHGVSATGEPLLLQDLPPLDLPQENAAVALQAYAMLGLPWEAERLKQALATTQVVGRLDRRQVIWHGKQLDLLLDVAHNPHASSYLAGRLASCPLRGRRLAVFGLLADKDIAGVVEPLLGVVGSWAVTPLPSPRSCSAERLAQTLNERGASVSIYPHVSHAIEAQCDAAVEGDELLIFGSFYCVAEALEWLDRNAVNGGRRIAG